MRRLEVAICDLKSGVNMAICARCGRGKLTERPCPRCGTVGNEEDVPRFREPKPLVPTLDMVHEAVRLLKLAGLVLHCPSRKTEACYYKWPGRASLIRVAAHSKGKSIISKDVVVSLTFKGSHLEGPNKMRLHPHKFEMRVWQAIGQYMIKSGMRELERRAEGAVHVEVFADGTMKTV